MTGEYKHFGYRACVINPSVCFACKQAMPLKTFKAICFYTGKKCLFAVSGRSLWYYIGRSSPFKSLSCYSRDRLLLKSNWMAPSILPSKSRAWSLFICSKDLCSTLNQQIFRGCKLGNTISQINALSIPNNIFPYNFINNIIIIIKN